MLASYWNFILGTVGLHHKKAREKSIKIGRLQRRTDRKVNFRVKKHWTFIVESLKFFLKNTYY